MGIRLMKRDYDLIDFVGRQPCFTDTLYKLFFSECNKSIAYRRLDKLAENDYIQRHRDSYYSPYLYFIGSKVPKQKIHLDLMARCYLFLKNNNYSILSWDREISINSIRPDVVTTVEKNGKTSTIYIEVERYNNSLVKKLPKYEELALDTNFSILYACNSKFVQKTNIKVNQIKIDDLLKL